jgi:hypothetical protein
MHASRKREETGGEPEVPGFKVSLFLNTHERVDLLIFT